MTRSKLLHRLTCLANLTAIAWGGFATGWTDFAFTQTTPPPDPAARADASPANDWPAFLGPDRNGISTQSIDQRDWNGLPLLWQTDLDEGYAMGSLQNGRFYQTHRSGDQEILLCLDADTGLVLWQQERATRYDDLYGYDGGPRSSPTLTRTHVYTYGVDGVVVCRTLADGNIVWQKNLNQAFGVIQNFFGVGSSPLVYQDLLLLMVGGSPAADQNVAPGALDQVTANDSAIVALDLLTGDVRYQVGQDLASYSSPILMRLPGTTPQPAPQNPNQNPPADTPLDIALAWCRSGLLAFDPASGKQHFHFPFRSDSLESVNAATPLVAGDLVLLSETYDIGSVLLRVDRRDLSAPQVVWQDDPDDRQQSLQAHWNTPVLVGDYLYASSGRHSANATLRCVEFKTGKVQWSQPNLTRCSLTAAGKDLVVVAERGEVFLIEANPQQFTPITQHRFADPAQRLRYPAWSAAIIADGKMFVRDKNTLFCFQIH